VNRKEMHPPKFLNGMSEEIPLEGITLTITQVGIEKLVDAEKPVARFYEIEAGMVVNVTNSDVMFECLGPDSDSWAGQKIVVFRVMGEFKGKRQLVVRVRPIGQPAPATQPTLPIS